MGDAAGTWENSFTAGPRAGTTGDSDTDNRTVSMGWRIVSSTGAYTASKTGITSRYWAAAIATFKGGAAGTTHELTMSVDPTGGGTTNPSVGTHVYVEDAVVNITATPNSGYQFDHWSGACSGSGTCQVTMDGDKSVTAHFGVASTGPIAHVADIGSATTKTTGTSLVITTNTAVAAGDGIIVGFSTYGDPDYEISVTDSVGNTYEQAGQAQCYEHGRTYIFAAYNVTALPSGGTITITHTSVSACVAAASSFTGLLDDALDQSLGNPVPGEEQAISGTAPTVGPTGTTAVAYELLVGAVGTEGPLEDAAGTWGNSFTVGPRVGTTGDTYDTNRTLSMGWRIVSSTGTYSASKSGITDRYWGAVIATFKGGETPVTYDLTVAVDPTGGGTTNPTAGTHTYDEDEIVNIEATPASGYQFDQWSGACSGSGTCQVTMDGDKSVIAHFTQITHDLTVSVDPAGGGTTNPVAGIHTYVEDAIVDIEATPASGYQFDQWSGACSGSGACQVTMDADKSVIAHFTQITHTLDVVADPPDGGTTVPAAGSHIYVENDIVTVTATANTGFEFDHWGGACSGSGACQVTMSTDLNVTAYFTQLPQDLTISVSPEGGGTTDPGVGVHTYLYGDVVDVYATPASGYLFDHWSGDCSGTGSCQILMDGDKSVIANFVEITYDLTISVEPVGSGTTTPPVGTTTYVENSVIHVDPTPSAGYQFDHWSGACSGGGTCDVTMDADKSVIAHFALIPPADTSIIDAPADPTNATDASFTFTSSESGATFECQLDLGGWGACTSPATYSGLGNGSHTFEVRATGASGSPDPTPASHTWTIDTVLPETAFTSVPAVLSGSADASFGFISNEPGTFECQLDGGGYGACSSPQGYTGLADGAHTFDVRAVDAAGNTDSTPASHTWTVDTTGPDTNITGAPANPSGSDSASFTFTATEGGSTFECQLDGGGYGACSSPKDYSSLTAGSHTFEVRATDPVGNVDPSPASYTWTIDVTAPDTTITDAPVDPTATGDASFSFTSTEGGSTFECQLDGGGYSACSSPQTYTGLADGSHNFMVRAIDPAGNPDSSPATHTWTVDTAPPDTSITSAPADPNGTGDASFEFESTESGSTYECQLDGGGYSACSSPKAYSGLADGSHTFEVRAIDPAGNADQTPASYTWLIDMTGPETTITDAPVSPSGSSDVSFAFSSSEAGSTYECQLDGGGFSACSSPQSYTALADGSHTFQVLAVDSLGNPDPTPASHTWTIDTLPPETALVDVPDSLTANPDASFSFICNEPGSTMECQLDGGGYSVCTSPKVYTGLADGAHAFDVRATDPAGNTDPTPDSYGWTIDTTAPDTTITAAPADPSASGDASFSLESTEPGSTFECQLDGGGFAVCSGTQNYNGLTDGAHVFDVRATDAVGNLDQSPASHTWTIDTVVPDTTISAAPVDPTGSSSASFEFESDDGSATFECQLDGGGFGACSSPQSYTSLADGAHTFHVRAVDTAGNTDASPASHGWTIDTTAPDTTITGAPADPSGSSTADFSFESDDTTAGFECELDGGGYAACVSPVQYAALGAGSHTFNVRAIDPVGNFDLSPASHTWTIDTDAPQTNLTDTPSDPGSSRDISFGFDSDDPTATFECQLDSGGFDVCVSPKTYLGLPYGYHFFEVRAVDSAGNSDPTPSTFGWTVERKVFLPIIVK